MIDTSLKFDRDALVSELERAGARFRGNLCRCPFHEDKHQSGSVHQGNDQAWRYKCHTPACGAAGDVYDIRARIAGKPLKEVLPMPINDAPREQAPLHETPKPKPIGDTLDAAIAKIENFTKSKLQARYEYTNPDTGLVEYHVVRLVDESGAKTFRPLTLTDGGFVMEAPPKPWPIYNRFRIKEAETVFVVEGEKCVHALHAVGVVATTSPGGAGKADYADWTPLSGKTCYLWPDKDSPDAKTGKRSGIAHMQDVARILGELNPPCRLFWIDPDREDLGLPTKGDVVEYLAQWPDDKAARQQAIRAVTLDAEPLGPAGEVLALIEDTISGKRRAIDWPWPVVTRLTRALLPGTLTLLCGDPGATKSFALLEAATYWHRAGEKAAIYELEEDRAFHLTRALSQLERDSEYLNPEFIEKQPGVVRAAFEKHKDFLDSFGRCIFEAADRQITTKELVTWIKARAQAGYRIISIDPVTAAEQSAQPWIDDARFIIDAKQIAVNFGLSLVFVTHPKKGRKGGLSMDDLAGGAAYARFAQTILWIERLKEPKTVTTITEYGSHVENEINRKVHILKARNGGGHGATIGFRFDGRTMLSEEFGAIVS